jgi:hypothetical protein
MASEVPKMDKQGTGGKRKHVSLMISQKFEIGGLKVAKARVWSWIH